MPDQEPNTQDLATNAPEFSVSELSQALKRTIEDNFGFVRVRGEISGYRGPHSSGHCYFGLKDESAKIDAVIWRGVFSRLRFKPEEGMEVIASGKLTTYPGRSNYQIVIEALEPAGAGALMALLEERRRKLAAEGLFDEARKQLLPYLPEVIGVITSPTGSVIRDILHRLADRFPRHVLVWPVRVQGETSAAEVTAAMRGFNALAPGGPVPRPDIIIVARGGGSIEELWGFNDEALVRAIAGSDIPVISAVGHETDWSLTDLVADVRAPTPTAAAEMAVPVRSELLALIDELKRRAARGSLRALEERRTALTSASRALPKPQDILALPRQRFDIAANALGQALRANTHHHGVAFARIASRLSPAALAQRMTRDGAHLGDLSQRSRRALAGLLAMRRQRLESNHKLLSSLSYQGVLGRGFALVRDAAGQVLRTAAAVTPGAALEIEFADGKVRASADGGGSAGTRPPAPRHPAGAKPKGGQGSLF